MSLRTPAPTFRDLVDEDTEVIAIETFRPGMSRQIERGTYYRLSSPIVRQCPQFFALVIRLDQLDDIIER